VKAQGIQVGRSSFGLEAGRHAAVYRAWRLPVTELATRENACLEPDTPASDAYDLLERLAVDVAPVVDREHRPVGIVSAHDLARALEDDPELRDDPEPDRLHAFARRGMRVTLDDGYRLERPVGAVVAELMTCTAPSLPETSSIALVAGVMRSHGVEHALITDASGRIVRVVSSNDIARWLAETGGIAQNATPRAGLVGAIKRPFKRPFPFRKAQRKSILVVEDDVEICDALVNLLSDEGFAALKASDGRQALQVLKGAEIHPGLILLDLMMPRMNGWEFRDEQLRDGELRSIPVVVLSALGTSIAERERMAPAAVLRKPVSAEALLDTVEQHFQRFN
jgi:CheY-like chemotaxis protein/CBS domain-containing protein